MRIAFVNATRRFGGVKAWTLDLAGWLSEHGHAAEIHARPGPFLERAQALAAAHPDTLMVVPTRFGGDANPALIARLFRGFRARGVDLAVVNIGKDLASGGLAGRLAGVPVVHRLGLPRDVAPTIKNRWLDRLVRPHILVPSEDTRQGVLAELPWLTPERVTAIHTGKRPAPEPPQSVAAPRRLAVASQLNPDKGHAPLLEALGRLAGQGLDFHLEVYGTGSEAAALEARTRELGLVERVTCHGFVQDVPARLARADIFVLPSSSEGLPNALLEAMAAGCAPVATRVGGVAEVWPHELARFLLPAPARPDDLVRALGELLAMPEADLLTCKRAAWLACRERFNLDTQARRIVDLFQQLITRRGTRP